MNLRTRNGRPLQNGSFNGMEPANGDHVPPPSTIAAQIVHARANVARQEPENKALFGKLLQEYLRDPVVEDTDVETNAQLLHVVAEAGLDVLLNDDPFSRTTLEDQAKDSILVIKLTIGRKSEVLLHRDGNAEDRPPLILWLLPKILNLFAARTLEAVQDELADLVSSIISALLRTTRNWRYGLALQNMLTSIVEDLLYSLETSPGSGDADFSISVPSVGSMSTLWPSARAMLVLPVGYQVSIKDRIQAQLVIPQILKVFNPHTQSSQTLPSPDQPSSRWGNDCCQRMLDICTEASGPSPAASDLVLARLCNYTATQLLTRCLKQRMDTQLATLAEILFCFRADVHPFLGEALDAIEPLLRHKCEIRPKLKKKCRDVLEPVCQELILRGNSSSEQGSLRPITNLHAFLVADATSVDSGVRIAKRRRIEEPARRDFEKRQDLLMRDIASSLNMSDDFDLDSSGHAAVQSFFSANKHEQNTVLSSLEILPCLASQCIGAEHTELHRVHCCVCDETGTMDLSMQRKDNSQLCQNLQDFVAILLEAPELRRSKILRIRLARIVRRVNNHLNDGERSLLGRRGIGHWLMRSLQSSTRELRIASGEALTAYIRRDLEEHVRSRNRHDVLDFLKALEEHSSLAEQETLILTWGLVGRTCDDAELNLTLIQLVDYLGRPHALVSGSAYHEVLQLAESRKISPLDLFKPFWSSLGTHVVKDLINSPQKAQQLADILGISVNDILLLTQAETIPYLILTRKRDVLQRIAQARGPKITVQDIWLQPPRNLAAVVSLLLIQPSEDPEQSAIALLKDAAPSFSMDDLSALVKVDPHLIACEILKYAGEYPDSKKSHAHNGLRLLAAINERRDRQVKSGKTSSKHLSTFLDAHILGIMSNFTDIVDATIEKQPISEKRKALRAVEQLIIVGKSMVAIAIPQIRATLQSAFKSTHLADDAFSSWSVLVAAASSEDIESLVHHTMSIVVQYWESFSSNTQKRAYDTIAGILKNHNSLIRDHIEMVPSLSGIAMLQKFENELQRFKAMLDPMILFDAFARRCSDESPVIVYRALSDLKVFLTQHQKVIHDSAMSQQPSHVVARLSRAVLDAVVRFKETSRAVPELAAQCMGAIGSIDPNRIDQIREKEELLLLSNFERASEVIDFVSSMLETVLVDAFHSAPTGRAQTYLAYTMQELLKFCGFRSVVYKSRSSQSSPTYQRWMEIPESTRSILTPFFNTKYVLVHPSMPSEDIIFPILKRGMTHVTWLRTFVYTLLHKATTENAQMVFPVLSRVIWGHDISIPTFLFPFVILNVLAGDDEGGVKEAIQKEFDEVFNVQLENEDPAWVDQVKQCSENIFRVLDYLSRWLQAKRRYVSDMADGKWRSTTISMPTDFDEVKETSQLSGVEALLNAIPADVLSRRAEQCRLFARALFHWEGHLRELMKIQKVSGDVHFDPDRQFGVLQDIYALIDEPDAVEGISTRLHILDPEQQILEHKRAGRWSAVQNWYELELAEKPDDRNIQVELLSCLKASNRYGPLLDKAQSLAIERPAALAQTLPYAAEAAWVTSQWKSLGRFMTSESGIDSHDFNVGIGKALLALKDQNKNHFQATLSGLRTSIVDSLSSSTTASLAIAHPSTIKLHVLHELEQISGFDEPISVTSELIEALDHRLNILGALTPDKQYLLGIRRAGMELSKRDFSKQQIAAAWLSSARLARKMGLREAAYDAVMNAMHLHDGAAKIEHSRLLWNDGHHRKAIENLQEAIATNVFQSYTTSDLDDHADPTIDATSSKAIDQNLMVAKTQLLLAKWMDRAGHSKADEIRNHYLAASKVFSRWEKGHYYLGKHYLKMFEAEKALPLSKQGETYISGDFQRLVVDNFLRSMCFGAKYYYETVPKLLTLWLDLAADIHSAERTPKGLDQENHLRKVKKLDVVHRQVKKYAIDRLPPYVFYTALPQMTSRINHQQPKASELLLHLIRRVISAYPQQALWSILAIAKSRAHDKSSRASVILNELKRSRSEGTGVDLKSLIAHGERLTNALLAACEVNTDSRSPRASLQKDLGFNHKLAPCQLVVPVQKSLTGSLPTTMGTLSLRKHNAFSRTPITISSFQDEVLVLSSLQRPKKLTMRGSDGELYGLLCKPKDDLRKDQRLMEFTTMIDRGLKRDVEASKRRLYIRTYAVVPLNEECGAIEWVDGLKPMRDIVIANYKAKSIRPDYGQLRQLLDRACAKPEERSWEIFSKKIIPEFPPVLFEWFIDTFPQPETWFEARLRYTRSCAVMSMVGNALGLGDRHGENILLQEGNGGCFHVDFNCLFDKGLTFEKPELVPFRLTHNMVDAFGIYGYEGPFRKASELTLKILQQYEDTLMTIMETFIYDPTTDFISKPKKRTPGVPETPAEVLDSVRAKIKGLLPGESVPLSVDGYADALIKMAVDPRRLASMYIGWCAFF